MKKLLFVFLFWLSSFPSLYAQQKTPYFRVIALYENGGHHVEYSKAAKLWLDELAVTCNFSIDYIQGTEQIDEAFLSKYQLFIQLDYAPYAWKEKAAAAFQDYITKGKGGWIGFHHATLLGEFDGYPIWPWFQGFMGGLRFKDYIPTFAQATVNIEAKQHPLMKGVSSSFSVAQEEWYTWDRSPRPNVKVLATVDESTYIPDSKIKMGGDHPVIWINPDVKAKNVYIFMGHSPLLFQNKDYTRLFRNAIFWAVGK